MGIADGYNMLAAQEAERHKARERNERVAELVKSALIIQDQWRVAFFALYNERCLSISIDDPAYNAEADRVDAIGAAAEPLWKQVRELLGLPPSAGG